MKSFRGARSPDYLFVSDLAQLIERRAKVSYDHFRSERRACI
jgi:hypothetical protein